MFSLTSILLCLVMQLVFMNLAHSLELQRHKGKDSSGTFAETSSKLINNPFGSNRFHYGASLLQNVRLTDQNNNPEVSILAGVKPFLNITRSRRVVKGSQNEDDNCPDLPPKISKPSVDITPQGDLIDYLNSGLKDLDADLHVDEAVLVMGNSGCGKSTFVQMLAGDLAKLHAVLTSSGGVVIVDEDDRIGLPLTTSKTLIPELVLLKEEYKTTAFYDCPGFNDNRGPDQDIIANFFIHQILRKVRKVKILFLVNYSSVTIGNDKLDFDLLAKHATIFLKNLSKYKASIGLVATKVDSFNGRGRPITDESVIEEISGFLLNYNSSITQLLSQNNATIEQGLIKRKLEFLNVLLTQDEDQKYTKLSFSRSPIECGQLDNSTVVPLTRKRALTLLQDNLKYSFVKDDDFGFSLKDSTLLKMKDSLINSSNAVAESISRVIKNFQSWYLTEHTTIEEEYTASSLLKNVGYALGQIEILRSNFHRYGNLSTASMEETVMEIGNTFAVLGYQIDGKTEKFVKDQQKYYNFFNAISGTDTFQYNNEQWLLTLQELNQNLTNLKNWYQFCKDTANLLGTYKYQKQKPYITKNDIDLIYFLESEWNFPVSIATKRLYEEMGQFQKNILFEILEFTLQQWTWTCDVANGHALITGTFVKLSSFFDRNGKRKATCLADTRINKIEIFATKVLFIDEDIQAVGEELNLVIISDKWDVSLGRRVFNLSGRNGNPIVPSRANDGEKYGSNGKAGYPGGPGGSFMGILHNSSNLNLLKISTSGGTGGKGQDGGAVLTCRGFNYGRSGDGGSPGKGGLPGRLQVTFLSKYNPMPELNSREGGQGQPGKVTAYRYHSSDCLVFAIGKPGPFYKNKVSNLNLIQIQPTQPTYLIKEWKSILNFKSLLYTASITNQETAALLDLIENDQSLKIHKSFKAYIEDLATILKICPTVSPKRSEIILQSYIKALEHFLYDLGNISRGGKKTAAYLFSLAYSTLAELDKRQSTDAVVDIVGYFNFLKERMADFKESTALKVIVDAQNSFAEHLETKIEFTKQIQAFDIQPALKQAESELNATMVLMGEQFIKLIQNAEADVDEIKKELKSAKDALTFQMVSKGITAIAAFGSMIFTGGATAGAAISTAIPVAEMLVEVASNQAEANGRKQSLNEVAEIVEKTRDVSGQIINGMGSFGLPLNSKAATAIKMSYYFGESLANSLASTARSKNEIRKLEAMVEEAELILKDVENRNKIMHDIFIPAVETTVSSFEDVLESLREDSDYDSLHPSKLKLAQFMISRGLKEIKENLFLIGRGLHTVEFTNALEKTQDYLEMMVSLFQDIENFQTTRNLGHYLSVLNSAQFQQIQVNDPRLSTGLARIQQQNTKNLFLIEYQKALHALRQWVFPFAKVYLTKDLEFFENDRSDDLAEVYSLQVRRIQLQLEKYKSIVVNSQDTHLIFANFSTGLVSSQPFALWDNMKRSDSIKNLLSGVPATFYADVRSSPEGMDAIKFNLVEIKLKVTKENETLKETQQELDETLNHFRVYMTHSGVSRYRFKGSFYSMYGENKTISYNYEGNHAFGDRQSANLVYQKFKNGDYMLSPYTYWTIQLVQISAKEGRMMMGTGFPNLKRFIPIVEVELHGKGLYVDSHSLPYDLEVDSFYEKDQSIRAENE